GRAGGDRALEDRVHIRDVEQDADRRAADRKRTLRAHLWMFVGEHDDRIADADFSVTDLAVGPGEPQGFGRAECFLVEVDRFRRATADDVRRRRMIAVGNRFHWGGHERSPLFGSCDVYAKLRQSITGEAY